MRRINKAKRRHLRLCAIACGYDKRLGFLVSGIQRLYLESETGGGAWLKPYEHCVNMDAVLVRP